MSATTMPVWATHMAPAFAAPRVFFIAGSEDMAYTEDTIVSHDTMAMFASDAAWNAFTQEFCPLKIEAAHALLRFRGEDDPELVDYKHILALCVRPNGRVEGFALVHLNDDEDEMEVDILCPGREGVVSEEKRSEIESILTKAIAAYDDAAFEATEATEDEDDEESEEEDEDKEESDDDDE
jgi:hypothetical protein